MLTRQIIRRALLKDRKYSSSATSRNLPELQFVLDALPLLKEPCIQAIPEEQKLAASYIIDHQKNTYTHANTNAEQELPTAIQAIRDLKLDAIYNSQELSDKRIVLGFHGCSINSAGVILHIIDTKEFGNQGSYHSNPDENNHAFHIANTLRAALHYAKLNGGSQSSYQNPEYYDDSIIVMSCAPRLNDDESYYSQELQAWNYTKNCAQTLGRECLISPEQIPGIFNYGLFRIKGPRRNPTLVEGQKIYKDKMPHLWSRGELLPLPEDVPHVFREGRLMPQDDNLLETLRATLN